MGSGSSTAARKPSKVLETSLIQKGRKVEVSAATQNSVESKLKVGGTDPGWGWMEVFAAAIIRHGIPVTTLIKMVEVDGNGSLNLDEFRSFCSEISVDLTEEEVESAFFSVDKDKSGSCSSDEFEALVKTSVDKVTHTEFSVGQVDDSREDTLLVALVAHNEMKPSMLNFVKEHLDFFRKVQIITTGSTGRALEQNLGLIINTKVSSGPLGGDQEVGASISNGQIGAVFFFRDPLSAHPHEPDIDALYRICDVHNCPVASNPASAKALVYSLESGGPNHGMLFKKREYFKSDSAVVTAYKNRQIAVINDLDEKAPK